MKTRLVSAPYKIVFTERSITLGAESTVSKCLRIQAKDRNKLKDKFLHQKKKKKKNQKLL